MRPRFTPASDRRPRDVRTWCVAWVVFTLLGAVWAVATPAFNVPDEPAHATYAAAAVRGQWAAATEGAVTTVVLPGGWVAADAGREEVRLHGFGCYIGGPTLPAGCADDFVAADGTAEVLTNAGRYPPGYYLLAGVPSLLVPDGFSSLLLMRLATAAMVGALLASAACSVLARRSPALGLTALAVAASPMLFFFAGSVNPQGPEIAAAILLWTSGIGWLTAVRSDAGRRWSWRDADLRRVVVAAAVLATVRPLSPLWLALVAGSLVVAFVDREVLRRLIATPALWTGIVAVTAIAVGTVGWVMARNALIQQSDDTFADYRIGDALFASVNKLGDEFREMIGVFGWLDTPAYSFTYLAWTGVLGLVVVLGVVGSSRRVVLAASLTALAVLVLPVALELHSFRVSGFAWQGRYTLPLAVGVPLLLGLSPRHELPGTAARRGVVLALSALGVAQFLAFVAFLARNMFGVGAWFGMEAPTWEPPVPAWVHLLLAAGVVTTAVVLAVRASAERDPADPESAEWAPDSTTGPGRPDVSQEHTVTTSAAQVLDWPPDEWLRDLPTVEIPVAGRR